MKTPNSKIVKIMKKSFENPTKMNTVFKNVIEAFNTARARFLRLNNVTIEMVPMPMYLATMNCRPSLASLLFPWEKRRYVISVNSRKNFARYSVPVELLSDEVLVGWFGHELSHVVQYERMSTMKFIIFVLKYFFDFSFRKNFEIEATKIAKGTGFGNECDAVENFLRNDPRIHKKYQKRFKKFYVAN